MGSRYAHDPEYGGKVSMSGWREAARLGGQAGPPQGPPPSMPPDHPRVRELIGAHAAAG